MDTQSEELWITCKNVWIPRPRWLGTGAASPAGRPGTDEALAAGRHPVSPAFRSDLKRPDLRCSNEQDPAPFKDRRKQRTVISPGGGGRATGDKPGKRPWENGPREKERGGRVPAEEHKSSLGFRPQANKINTDNVVDLRPRLREQVYAERLLKALCAACEAQATGQHELLMIRIKEVYHLFEDLERFPND